MICEIICVDGFLCISHLDIVHMLFAYLDVICILSEHMHIIRTLSAVVLDMFISNTYHVQFSFHTLSIQNAHCQCYLDVVRTCTYHRETWLVDDICHPHVICRWIHHPHIVCNTLYICYHLQLSFRTFSTQMHIVNAM